MREQQAELDRLGVRVFAVTFESEARVRRFRSQADMPFPILRDPRREAYRAFGMHRRPVRSMTGLATGIYYVKQALHGRFPRLTRSDYAQLGGDVLLSASGQPHWTFVSREPADRPSIEQVMQKVRACAGA